MIRKEFLNVGEQLKHDKLGAVTYTVFCDQLEKEHGDKETLFVELNGKVCCLTLALISREKE